MFSQAGLVSLVLSIGVAASTAARAGDVSDLFDPVVIARNICGHRQMTAGRDLQTAALPVAPSGAAHHWDGLGTLSFTVTTSKPEAQSYFDQGLRLMYGFNHGEAIRSFRAAQAIDPDCAMCFWGESLSLGPNLNYGMTAADNAPALKALGRAKALEGGATPRERALIDALALRYATPFEADRHKRDLAYAEAMGKVHAAYPDDPDIATLFAESLMDSNPFPWWESGGHKATGRMGEAVAAIEGVLRTHPQHPGAIHYYIHIMETSAWPEKAAPYADMLGALMPAAGHMVHMPSHTYYRIGRYKDAMTVNLAAVAADEDYLRRTPDATRSYRYGYYPHNVHFAMAAAGRIGDKPTALAMSAKLTAAVKSDDYYLAAAIWPHVDFDPPDALLALPEPADSLTWTTAMWRFARGTAYALKADTAGVEAEISAIMVQKIKAAAEAKKKDNKPKPTDPKSSLFDLASEVLRGRLAMAQNNWPEAVARLERAAAIQDELHVITGDPPVWDYPVRQSLGAALLLSGDPQKATEVLRHALMDTPDNGAVLYALQKAASASGDALGAEEYGKLFAKAWIGSDPPDLGRM